MGNIIEFNKDGNCCASGEKKKRIDAGDDFVSGKSRKCGETGGDRKRRVTGGDRDPGESGDTGLNSRTGNIGRISVLNKAKTLTRDEFIEKYKDDSSYINLREIDAKEFNELLDYLMYEDHVEKEKYDGLTTDVVMAMITDYLRLKHAFEVLTNYMEDISYGNH